MTGQSALSILIGEVLADPELAHQDVCRRMLQAGPQDLMHAVHRGGRHAQDRADPCGAKFPLAS
ncbi:MAG: hypothetical protein WA967_08130 [Microbacterium sp.]